MFHTLARRCKAWLTLAMLALLTQAALAAVPPAERAALVNLYNNTNGPGWGFSTNWTVGDPCDDGWHGVTCDAGNTHVTGLQLVNNLLAGPLPISDLNALTMLERLWLDGNRLSGPIPDLSGLVALTSLWLNGNQLSGTPPAAPGTLIANQSRLCPNFLHTPSPTEGAWNTATGGSWSTGCTAGYLVSASAGANGSVSPVQQGVAAGSMATITLTPNAGFVVDAVISSCGASTSATTVTTGAVGADCTVNVSFKTAPIAPTITSVPTLGEWALILLSGLLGLFALRQMRRQQVAPSDV